MPVPLSAERFEAIDKSSKHPFLSNSHSPRHALLIDFQRAISGNLNHHDFGPGLGRSQGRLLWYLRLQTQLLVRNDHKDDQQHEQNLNQQTTFISNRIPRSEPPTSIPTSHLATEACPARRTLTSPKAQPQKGSRRETYCPASSFAVIRPTLSMPEPRMMSMARATSANSTSLSPLTKATFSARSLKICSMRGPRSSQVESSLLIFDFSVVEDLHDDRLILQVLILLLVRIRLRHQRIQALGCQRRDHHENNQKHEQECRSAERRSFPPSHRRCFLLRTFPLHISCWPAPMEPCRPSSRAVWDSARLAIRHIFSKRMVPVP